MMKPKLSKLRIGLAFAVAGFADLLQIPVSHVLAMPYLGMAGEFADYALDMITAALTILLLGFDPALFPTFILKALKSTALMPTWTACVGYVVLSRKGGATEPPPGEEPAKAEDTEFPAEIAPTPHRPQSPLELKPAGSGRWILITGAAVIACVIWFKHKPAWRAGLPALRVNAAAAPAPQMMPIPNANQKTVVAVGPMENLSSPVNTASGFAQPGPFQSRQPAGANPANLNAEAICSAVEDQLAQIDGVEVLGKQQMRLLRSQLNDKTDGVPEIIKSARLRNLIPANIIVLLAVTDVHDERKDFKGYGIEKKSVETKCSLRMQVMNAADGSITYSRTLSGSKTESQTDALTTSSTQDAAFAAIKNALATLEDDSDFKTAVRGKTPPVQNINAN
jgi:hypothetical protein